MSDLYERLVVQRVKPSGKVYDERPVEPVGTITVPVPDSGGYSWASIDNDPLDGAFPVDLPPGEYLIVPAPKEADGE